MFLLASCISQPESQFIDRSKLAGISFSNDLTYTEDFNPYTYKSYFNGGGVALGDINNDGLLDIYLTGNLVDNKLYLNKGNWQFEDITNTAGVGCHDVWSSGATFADLNSDGYLDLYVCKSGKPEGDNRHNELFINNGDLTFTERSKEFGLDITGLSTHAAFFDYDKDGDLDCYLLTNSIKSIGGYDLIPDQREIPDPLNGGNKFLVNHNQKFYDSTLYKGVYSSEIGFGLGITLSDFNNDSWTDIFVSNDFFERDYLYINQHGKGFIESLESYFGSISMGSMGADAADLNNDLLPDLFVTEMLPREVQNQRTKTVFESWDKHELTLSKGYFNQYSRNVLQMNTPDQNFIELGRYGDVAATDWSWGALMFDMNNDGLKDIFVSNGIYKDLLDRDYLTFAANEQQISKILKEKGSVITDLLEQMPTTPVPNRAFINKGDFHFDEQASALGLGSDSYSNGSAYGDLDNDGDYDLVVNNVGSVASIYENRAPDNHHSLSVQLKGNKENEFAIGAKVTAFANGKMWLMENYPSRGFQSSVDNRLILGLGPLDQVDSLIVTWPDDRITTIFDVRSGSIIIEQAQAMTSATSRYKDPGKINRLKKVDVKPVLTHKENNFVDFNRDRLLPMMFHNEGPGLIVSNLDEDFSQEVLLGGSKQNPTQFIKWPGVQDSKEYIINEITRDSISEDNSIHVADFNGDGTNDLLISSGGKAYSKSSNALLDRIYLNDGQGNFVRNKTAIPQELKISTGAVVIADFDKDGDVDLFLAERFHPVYYATDVQWYILLNDGHGNFTNETASWFSELKEFSMATDADTLDFNKDGFTDMVVSTDWGPITLLQGTGKSFINVSKKYGLDQTGWWSSVEVADIDFDGDQDIIAGNHGTNSFFRDSIRLYVKDFDKNGTLEYFYCHKVNNKYYPIADRDEIISQLPGLKKRILYFNDYADMTIYDLFTDEELDGAKILQANTLKSTSFTYHNDQFVPNELPWQLQLSPIYEIKSYIKRDHSITIFFGGNQYMVKPQFGRFDAMPLTMWHIEENNSSIVEQTSFFSQIRAIEIIDLENKTYVFTASTNDELQIFEYH
jgi:hypothetical protein